jgi:hypothetical protein
LVLVFFGKVILQRSIYCKEGGGELFLSDGGGRPPTKALLVGALAQLHKQLASSDFTFRTRKKGADAKYGE